MAILLAVATPGVLTSASAQVRTETPGITVTCKLGDEFPLPTSSDTVPVVVTYMRNTRRAGDNVEMKLTKDRIRAGFAHDGEFNKIWGPKGIELALIGFRTCSYTLGRNWDPDPQNPRADVPKPDVTDAFDNVFLKVLYQNNTRTIKRDGRDVGFHGLDLYLWWDIAGYPGFSVRPRFGRQEEMSGRGSDEPLLGRPGAIWMDKECVDQSSCLGTFAHEVGHFFGLCHCCHSSTDSPRCINALKLEYCPGLGQRTPDPISCTIDSLKNRLMSATNPQNDPHRHELISCEIETAREGVKKVLKIGANGIP